MRQAGSEVRHRQRGFTLVEIMVVVVILGLLSTLVVQNVMKSHRRAMLDKTRADVSSLKSTVDLFMLTTGRRETPTWQMLITRDPAGEVWLEGLTRAPRDPYGNEYVLRGEAGGTGAEVISWGPDGVEGSEDDISSRSLRDSGS